MNYDNLQRQLDEIREVGCLNVGYANAIFKDENFDLYYTMNELLPNLIESGILSGKAARDYAQHILLDEYLSDLEVEEFYYLARYFFNYNRNSEE